MRSTSSLARPLDAVIVIFCSFPVPRSLAETLTMPLASMSKVTSTCGTPRGAGDHFVRVDAFVRLLPEQLLDDRLDLGNPRRPADEHDLVDLRQIEARVGQRLFGRADGLLQQVVDELLELRARQLHLQMFGT